MGVRQMQKVSNGMERTTLLMSLFGALLGFALVDDARGQLIIREELGSGFHVFPGYLEYYPPLSPYARPRYFHNFYEGYGYERLEGRLLALPWGFSPPASPQGVERFTVARERMPARPEPKGRWSPPYYRQPSYIRNIPSRSYIRR